ncbi:MAG: hypothetical protein R3D29_14245 [Nitratireductor sp.]
MLVEQIRQRILTRRGVMAESDEILVTMGAQNALFLIANLLVKPDTPVHVEDPGYPDIRNMFALLSNDLRTISVDGQGLRTQELKDGGIVAHHAEPSVPDQCDPEPRAAAAVAGLGQ